MWLYGFVVLRKAINHKAIKPEFRPISGYLIASQAAITQAFTPTNAANAIRANITHRFVAGRARKTKLNATSTVAVSHTTHSSALLPDGVGGTLDAARHRTPRYSSIQ